MKVSQQDPTIRASEIAQYAYCARAWWLGQVLGYRSSNLALMRQGTSQHLAHGQAVQRFRFLRRLAAVMLASAVMLAVTWLVLTLGR